MAPWTTPETPTEEKSSFYAFKIAKDLYVRTGGSSPVHTPHGMLMLHSGPVRRNRNSISSEKP
jgi:hypothetical protein